MIYGPAGKALKTKIESVFRHIFQQEKFFEIETPVLYPQKAWEASGHFSLHSTEMFSTSTSDGVMLSGRPEMATTIFSLYPLLESYFKSQNPIKVCLSGISLPNDLQTEWQTRTRQYTAHEGHLIFANNNYEYDKVLEYLKNLAFRFMESIGIPHSSLVFREKVGEDQPFYATKGYGLYYQNSGEDDLELLGIQFREDHDFIAHSIHPKMDGQGPKKLPHDFEISFSTDRPLFVLLSHCLVSDSGREYRNFTAEVSPFPLVILPVNNTLSDEFIKENIAPSLANKTFQVPTFIAHTMSHRYQHVDYIGIPYVLVVDKNNNLFLRDRNSATQQSIKLGDLKKIFACSSTEIALIQNIKSAFI